MFSKLYLSAHPEQLFLIISLRFRSVYSSGGAEAAAVGNTALRSKTKPNTDPGPAAASDELLIWARSHGVSGLRPPE